MKIYNQMILINLNRIFNYKVDKLFSLYLRIYLFRYLLYRQEKEVDKQIAKKYWSINDLLLCSEIFHCYRPTNSIIR
jgi:hypothetical protein